MDHDGNPFFENCAYCDRRIPYPRTTCDECEAREHGATTDPDVVERAYKARIATDHGRKETK